MSRRQSPQGVFHVTTLLAVVLLLLIVFVSVGYYFFIPQKPPGPTGQQQLAELAEHRERWQQIQPLSYRYVVERQCDACEDAYTEPYIATEERGRRSARFLIPVESASGDMLTAPPEPVWLEHLFESAEQAIIDDTEVRIEYDGRFGFPAELAVRNRETDYDRHFVIRDFEILEYRGR